MNFVLDVDSRLLSTFGGGQKKPLTTAQANIAVKAIARCVDAYPKGNVDRQSVIDLLAAPAYRMPLVQSKNIPREVRHLGGHLLGFRFKVNEAITDRLKIAMAEWPAGDRTFGWDFVSNIWVVPVTRKTWPLCVGLISDFKFDFDDEVCNVLSLCEDSFQESHACVLDPETNELILNVCNDPALAQWAECVMGGTRI
jgi:hypothetical protein